jgi:hypothetical protein
MAQHSKVKDDLNVVIHITLINHSIIKMLLQNLQRRMNRIFGLPPGPLDVIVAVIVVSILNFNERGNDARAVWRSKKIKVVRNW